LAGELTIPPIRPRAAAAALIVSDIFLFPFMANYLTLLLRRSIDKNNALRLLCFTLWKRGTMSTRHSITYGTHSARVLGRGALYLAILLILPANLLAKRVQCAGPADSSCLHLTAVSEAAASLPWPSEWDIVVVEDQATWGKICDAFHVRSSIESFTNFGIKRTYLNAALIRPNTPPVRIRELLAHELGHILTGSQSESVANAKAVELLK
jgi:hypothetical protein